MQTKALASEGTVHFTVFVPRERGSVGLVRRVIRCVLDDLEIPEDDCDELVLAMTEGCENVVEHAAGTSQYHVTARLTDKGGELDVCDAGPGLDLATFEDATAASPSDESGRGLAVMRQLTDDLELIDLDAGTCVRLHKQWAAH